MYPVTRSKQSAAPIQNGYQAQRKMSHEEMVTTLAQETGIEVGLAREYLSSNNWNLTEAIEGYRQLLEQDKQKRDTQETKKEKPSKREFGRGFSLSNMALVQEVRDLVVIDETTSSNNEVHVFDTVLSRKNFVLPDISKYNTELATFIRNDLISITTLQNLVAAGRLNWWAELGTCRKLFPLSTVGDGNCLLHAASLGMWGFHDRLLNLRKSLHQLLLHPEANKALRRRWKYSIWQDNLKCGGLTYSHAEWSDEWKTVVKLTSDRPHCLDTDKASRRKSRQLSFTTTNEGTAIPHLREGESLDSLEAIHVYALSNLLCRPIIVIAEEMLKDSHGHDVAPIPFGGVYLPYEREASKCSKYPLVLTYDASHFSALVCAHGEESYKGERLSTSTPLEDQHFRLLPLRFCIDPGSTWDLVQDDSVKNEIQELTIDEKISHLRRYMELVRVPLTNVTQDKITPKYKREFSLGKALDNATTVMLGEKREVLLAVKLNIQERPHRYEEMMQNYLKSAKERFIKSRVKCLTCNFAANPDCNGFCSDCYKEISLKEQKKIKSNSKEKLKTVVEKRHNSDALVERTNVSKDPQLKFNKTSSEPSLTIHQQTNIQQSNKLNHNIIQTITLPPSSFTRDMVVPITDTRTSGLQRDGSGGQKVVTSQPKSVPNQTVSPPPYHSSFLGTTCRTNGCRFYGSEKTNGFCSSCYKQYQYRGV